MSREEHVRMIASSAKVLCDELEIQKLSECFVVVRRFTPPVAVAPDLTIQPMEIAG